MSLTVRQSLESVMPRARSRWLGARRPPFGVRRGWFFMLTIAIATTPAVSTLLAAEFAWHDAGNGTTQLKLGERVVLDYMHAFDRSTPATSDATYKVFHHVFSPPGPDSAVNLPAVRLTKGPGGLYTHHRGLYCGWNKTISAGKPYDFWHCTNGDHQRHVRFIHREASADEATMTAEIHWLGGDGKLVVNETRTVRVEAFHPQFVSQGWGPGWLIDWSATLAAGGDDVVELKGDRQHAGFQIRADNSVAETLSARYLRPANFPQTPDAVQVDDATDPGGHANLDWLAMTFPIDDQQFVVTYIPGPKTPRPNRFSERPYGRFGAFFETSVEPGKPLALTYRVIVAIDQGVTASDVAAEFAHFAAK